MLCESSESIGHSNPGGIITRAFIPISAAGCDASRGDIQKLCDRHLCVLPRSPILEPGALSLTAGCDSAFSDWIFIFKLLECVYLEYIDFDV